jgi:hypothetical protein
MNEQTKKQVEELGKHFTEAEMREIDRWSVSVADMAAKYIAAELSGSEKGLHYYSKSPDQRKRMIVDAIELASFTCIHSLIYLMEEAIRRKSSPGSSK